MSHIIEKVILTFVVVTLAMSIISVILNSVIYKKQRDMDDDINALRQQTAAPPETTTPSPPPTATTPTTTTTRIASTNPAFKEAAERLLKGLNTSFDPCDNFYMFACGKYLAANPVTGDIDRIGTYDESQDQIVNGAIASRLNAGTGLNSNTEKILSKIFTTCVQNANSPTVQSQSLYDAMNKTFHGFPMLDSASWVDLTADDLWKGIGILERNYALPTVMQSFVTVDYMNIAKNTLYINQVSLPMARDYFVKPQFLNDLNDYIQGVAAVVKRFAKDISKNVDDGVIDQNTSNAGMFETTLALASIADEELRNYREQYNSYTLAGLELKYPSIGWKAYLKAILGMEQIDATYTFVISQPSYVSALNAMFAEGVSQQTVVNYLLYRMLTDNADFLSQKKHDSYRELYKKIKQLRGEKDVWSDENQFDSACVSVTLDYMPYANGYTYLKTIPADERNKTRADVTMQSKYIIDEFVSMFKTLEWMTNASKARAAEKADALRDHINVGWPDWYGDFEDATSEPVDDYHKEYNGILGMNDWFSIFMEVKRAYQVTENFGLYNKSADRKNFLMSPALVNAWYQPERNSITFPYAAFNPPYYRLDFPQAYNYAGQGGTAGHELTHGFDDEGVQFGKDGALADCTWNHCGWMDTNSTLGFTNMAQCVVTQYSQKCCPRKTGNVHCTSGERTQGENIADLGGQLAAYKAYRRYIKDVKNGTEEAALPGLEQFTPNQIFWLTYGFSWCMSYSDASLLRQLMTNPHAPGDCRVNEVFRDIPEFAQDFNCKLGVDSLYPKDDERCHVWTK